MSLEVVMLWSEGCEACQRTKPIVHKIAMMHPSIEFHYHKVVNTRYEYFMLNQCGISVEEDVTLPMADKIKYLAEGIPEISAMPTFYLRRTREPFKILEIIVGGVLDTSAKERQAFERMFHAMLDKYDEIENHRKAFKSYSESKLHYGEFEVRMDSFPNM